MCSEFWLGAAERNGNRVCSRLGWVGMDLVGLHAKELCSVWERENSGFSKSSKCSWKRRKDAMQEVQLRIEESVIKGNLGLEVRTN